MIFSLYIYIIISFIHFFSCVFYYRIFFKYYFEGFGWKFYVGSLIRHKTPNEGRRTHRPKCEFKNEDNNPITLNDKSNATFRFDETLGLKTVTLIPLDVLYLNVRSLVCINTHCFSIG